MSRYRSAGSAIRSTRAIRPTTSTATPARGTGTRTRPTFPTGTGSAMDSPASRPVASMPVETGPNGRRVIVTGADCRVAACDADGAGADAVAGATTSAEFDVRDRAAVRQGVAGAVTALG